MTAAAINTSSNLTPALEQAFSHCESMHNASKESSFNADEVSKTAVNHKKHILLYHKSFFSDPHSDNSLNNYKKEVETSSLFSETMFEGKQAVMFNQYRLLAEQIVSYTFEFWVKVNIKVRNTSFMKENSQVFLNVNTSWSAFICGFQGSGKSYTLSCMLKSCLLPFELGALPCPLTAMIFHYDMFTSHGSIQICEAVYLYSSSLSVKVLISSTNYT